MIWLLVPISIWILALFIMGLPKFVYKRVQQLKVKLKKNAKLAKQTNPDESIYKSIEESILETVDTENLCLTSSIIGSVLIALGTVALCIVLLI